MRTARPLLNFKILGPRMARTMAAALKKLTGENIKVVFDSVHTHIRHTALVDCRQKCFACHTNFGKSDGSLQGVAAVILPLPSTRTLIELMLRRLHCGHPASCEMKLSTFKEAGNILLAACVTEMARTLKTRLRTGVPKFACFRTAEFAKPTRAGEVSHTQNSVSLGQFRIIRPTGAPPIAARLILVF